MRSSRDNEDLDSLLVLYAKEREAVGRRYPLRPSAAPITIGRSGDRDIVLRSDAVSRRHARLEAHDDGWWVIDEASTHGTYVNEERAPRARLRSGDQLRIGDAILKFLDASEPREIVEVVYTATPFDGLTGLHNLRHLVGQIEGELARAQERGLPLTLALFNVDGFKRVNDAHGHEVGDRVLQELAALVREHVGAGEVLARRAGDALALLLPGTDEVGAAARAEAIRAAIAAHRFGTIAITVSVGVAQARTEIRTADELLGAAGEALRAGRARRASPSEGS